MQITKQNLLYYFRYQRSKAQAFVFFGCVSSHEIESKRHVKRFDMILGNLIKKGMIVILENNKYRAIHDRDSQPRLDDAEVEV